jgi:hypothetical protein
MRTRLIEIAELLGVSSAARPQAWHGAIPRVLTSARVDLEQLERVLRERLDPSIRPHAELLHDLMLPDFDRADAIGAGTGGPQDAVLRRAPDRLRGGPDAPERARRDAGEDERR